MDVLYPLGFATNLLLGLGIVMLFFSLYFFFVKQNVKTALILLFLAGFMVRCFMLFLDPWLNGWDEVYHALVAKNFTKHFLIPTLYDEPLFRLGSSWVGSNIWLHKQPLFLWQMALSIKLFGNTVFAARFPSAILSSIAILLTYDIGKRMISIQAGYYAALIYSFAYFPLELACGSVINDHNDTAFVFYITASIWAWLWYNDKPTFLRAALVGCFAGMSILVKWLVGLLVFAGWGIVILSVKGLRNKHTSYLHILFAFFFCCLVFLPWQFYIFQAYPLQARDEMEMNTQHFTHVVEFHGGPWYYHLQNIRVLYPSFGEATPYLLLLCIIVTIFKMRSNIHRIFVVSCIFVVYVFFSLAATKMISFCFIVSPLVYVCIGGFIYYLFNKRDGTRYQWLTAVFMVILITEFINYRQINLDHFANNKYFVSKEYVQNIRKLGESLDAEKVVLFNIHYHHSAEIQYFTNLKCYTFIPVPEQLEQLYAMQLQPVIMDNGDLPEYIKTDIRIRFLKDEPWNTKQ